MKIILIVTLCVLWCELAKTQDNCFTKGLQSLCIKFFKKSGIVDCIRTQTVTFNQEDLTFCLTSDDTFCMAIEEACPR
jgi:hypothetical protein